MSEGDAHPALGSLITIGRHGASYQIHDPGGHIGIPIADGRPYESRLLDAIHRRGFTGSALDVGAHVGNHSLFLAAVCGLSVIAIEPSAAAFRILVANIAANPGLDIEAMRVAAGAEPGRARLNAAQQMIPDPDGPFDVVRLDDVVFLPDLSVVKVDVEGAEPQVLAGLTAHLDAFRPVVYAETHTRTADRATGAVLEPLGYERTGRVVMGSVMVVWEAR